MENILRYLRRTLGFFRRHWLWVPIGLVVLVNVKLYTGPDLKDRAAVVADVLDQMRYLEPQLHDKQAAERMQKIYPEGYVFTQALYGLVWCQLAQSDFIDKALMDKALREARFAFANVDSRYGRETFFEEMDPPFGMFYLGWRNYLLAKIVQASHGGDQAEVEHFRECSEQVAACFRKSRSPYPDSYPGQSWPADACVGMASIALYNQLVEPRFDTVVQAWVDSFPSPYFEPLLPHRTLSGSSAFIEGPRGCSGALNLIFLPDIDADLATHQFVRFNRDFGATRLGMHYIHEYPFGTAGEADIDSGPRVFGIGFSATIVGIGSYLRFGAYRQAQAMSDAVEAFGFSHNLSGKRYLFGQLPVSDLFLAWARLQRPGNVAERWIPKEELRYTSKWSFQLMSVLLVLLVLCVRFWRPIGRFLGSLLSGGKGKPTGWAKNFRSVDVD